jgi:phage shock protein A
MNTNSSLVVFIPISAYATCWGGFFLDNPPSHCHTMPSEKQVLIFVTNGDLEADDGKDFFRKGFYDRIAFGLLVLPLLGQRREGNPLLIEIQSETFWHAICMPDRLKSYLIKRQDKEEIMAILSRIKRLVSANLNSLLEKAEDPESLLEELTREMDASVINLRSEVTRSIASERRLARKLEAIERKIRLWDENSEKAVRDGDDDLARRALARKLAEERNLAEYAAQHARAKEAGELLESQLRILENKVQNARRKKEVLLARKRSAQARKAMLTATRDFDAAARKSDELLSDSGLVASAPYTSLEDQVLDLESEADAMATLTTREPDLEQVFEKSKADEEIERQLWELKKRLNKIS